MTDPLSEIQTAMNETWEHPLPEGTVVWIDGQKFVAGKTPTKAELDRIQRRLQRRIRRVLDD